ncbi:MAG: hypothetical protein NTV08_17900 [Verrucomicrobia bacterium]|nr:hypothetical protein [Verrucomicrobiota bacterium]
MSRAHTAATVRAVKYLLLLAFALLAGCETTRTKDSAANKDCQKYTKLTVTDLTGDMVSEWIAEGRVKKADQGYTIKAVERRSGPPNPTESKYPNGRISTVAGQNIILEDVEKPEWLKKLDGEK